MAVRGLKGGISGGSIGHVCRGPEGVAPGGQARERSSGEKVGEGGENSEGDG